MLRSLVGSEMCIRDRIVVFSGLCGFLWNIFWLRHLFQVIDKQAVGLYAACLLYTSDAADDLLWVDLGGRRIIKKKKIYKHKSSRQVK